MSSPVKVLTVEPWYGGSHRYALEALVRHSACRYELVTLPARFWKWRMQGAAIPLARMSRNRVAAGFAPDVVLVTSMVNVPAFATLTTDFLADIPRVLLMHENQLTYTLQEDSEPDYTYGFINYLSCLSADAVVFNSNFHRDAFLEALHELLRRLPDHIDMGSVDEIRSRSSVIHLGIECDALERSEPARNELRGADDPLRILWNHRWEYDKNPESFFRVLRRLDDAGTPFQLVLLGEDFGERPAAFDEARDRLGDRILAFGRAPSVEEYRDWLHRSDVVVSTANQEFFGLSVLEAVHCGCHPLLPARLSYPEIMAPIATTREGVAPVLYESEEGLFEVLRLVLQKDVRTLPLDVLRQATARYDWRRQASRFDDLLGREVRASRTGSPD